MLSVRDPELDLLYRQTVGKGAKILSVTQSEPGEGTSTFATALARRGAAVGLNTVLVDANVLRPTTSESLALPRTNWSPQGHSARAALRPVADLGVTVLPAPIGVDPLAFRESDAIRRMFEQEFRGFDLIVVDSSPVMETSRDAIPPEVVAAACSATVFVVLSGVTSEYTVGNAVERLVSGGATLAGAVLNDRFNPSLAEELGRQIDRVRRVAPGLAGRLQRRLLRSSLLTLEAR